MFQLTFSGDEIKERIGNAADWHETQAKRYNVKHSKRKERGDDEDEIRTPLGTFKNNYLAIAAQHKERARLLRLIAEHVNGESVDAYELTLEETEQLELFRDCEEVPKI